MNIRLNDDFGLEVEFRPGQWAQFAIESRTQWTQPDAGKNKDLRQASEGLLAEMARRYNEHAALVAVAEAAKKMTDAIGHHKSGEPLDTMPEGFKLYRDTMDCLATLAAVRGQMEVAV